MPTVSLLFLHLLLAQALLLRRFFSLGLGWASAAGSLPRRPRSVQVDVIFLLRGAGAFVVIVIFLQHGLIRCVLHGRILLLLHRRICTRDGGGCASGGCSAGGGSRFSSRLTCSSRFSNFDAESGGEAQSVRGRHGHFVAPCDGIVAPAARAGMRDQKIGAVKQGRWRTAGRTGLGGCCRARPAA